MEKADAAEYVGDMARALSAVSHRAKLPVLACLLDMVILHAEGLLLEHDPMRNRAKNYSAYYATRGVTLRVPSE